MKTSLWVVVVLVSGFIGFLIGYSVSAHTGTRAAETITATTQKPATPAAASTGGHGQPAAAAGGYGEKPAAPAASGAAPAPAQKKGGATAGY